MPTVEERIAAVEAKVDAIADLKTMIAELRTDMNRQFAESRADMNRQFAEVRSDMDRRFTAVDQRFSSIDRRFEIMDRRMDTHFMWMVGIQFSVLIAVIVALIRLSPG